MNYLEPMESSHHHQPTIVVLDTNVCLDLFIFRDPRCAAILEALQNGKAKAMTRDDCRREWQIVLSYPQLKLDEAARQRAAEEFDGLITVVQERSATLPASGIVLPLCSDPDDQKFLEIARDSGAQALITKDKALLKLAKRIARAGMFSITLPELWKPVE